MAATQITKYIYTKNTPKNVWKIAPGKPWV